MARRGEYNTHKKECVLDYITSLGSAHITADGLVDALGARGIRIGRTTAYRHLEQLTKQGLVSKNRAEAGGCVCYRYTGASAEDGDLQMHCICTKCEALLHVSCELIREIGRHFQEEHAFRLDPARTVLYGVCQKCAEEENDGASDVEPCDDGL
ncbi:MAG: Fur family transcriptional regulator [Christensenellales bacterium]|jgi:Fur family ferric uptake transcriptional regulator